MRWKLAEMRLIYVRVHIFILRYRYACMLYIYIHTCFVQCFPTWWKLSEMRLMYLCVYAVGAYIYIHEDIHIYSWIYTYIFMNISGSWWSEKSAETRLICIYEYMYIQHTYIHIHVHRDTNICIERLIYLCVYMYMCMDILVVPDAVKIGRDTNIRIDQLIYLCVYMHIYIYIYISVFPDSVKFGRNATYRPILKSRVD